VCLVQTPRSVRLESKSDTNPTKGEDIDEQGAIPDIAIIKTASSTLSGDLTRSLSPYPAYITPRDLRNNSAFPVPSESDAVTLVPNSTRLVNECGPERG
jgi:hypothetical protein